MFDFSFSWRKSSIFSRDYSHPVGKIQTEKGYLKKGIPRKTKSLYSYKLEGKMDIKNQDERGFFTRANFMAYSLREVSKRKGSLCADLARSQSRFVPKLLVTNAVESINS